MKQIYIGPKQRSELMTIRRKTIRPLHWVQVAILGLLILIPILFKSTIWGTAGNYSPVAYVETYSGSGSAVFIGNNTLLTAAHVVSDMVLNDICTIRFEDPNDPNALPILAEAELLAKGNWTNSNQDPEQDFALLHISTLDASKLVSSCSLGTSSNVKVKDGIIVEGYPSGNHMVTEGIVGSLALQDDKAKVQYKTIFTVDAKAWHGNSGGAMFDKNNNLLGIVTMGGFLTGFNDGQTYVLKIDHIKSLLNAKGFQL